MSIIRFMETLHTPIPGGELGERIVKSAFLVGGFFGFFGGFILFTMLYLIFS